MSFDRKKERIFAALIIMGMLLASCSGTGNGTVIDTDSSGTSSETSAETSTSASNGVSASGTELSASDIAGATPLVLSGDSATIDKAGTYLVSGSISDGCLTIDVEKTDSVTLILNGVSLSCSTGAAIYVKQADKVTLYLAEGSENNIVSDGFSDDVDTDGAIHAKDDIVISGSGSLYVKSTKNGIEAKDSLSIESGVLSIEADNHAIKVKDNAVISGGDLTLKSGKDGIHAENKDDETLGNIYIYDGSLTIVSDGGDGIDAAGVVQISGGSFDITTGGGSPETISGGNSFSFISSSDESDTASMKGIKSDGDLTISGGAFNVDSYDDAFHTNSNMTIDGGDFDVLTGGDGFHADDLLTVNGGTIRIDRCYEGLEGKDVTINGGDITLTASDDGINAAGDDSGTGGFFGKDNFSAGDNCITITGGVIRIDASGDGIDSNGDLVVSGGEVYVSGPTSSGDGALDYDGNASVTGGIVIAAGSQGMAMNFGTDSTQPSMLVNFSATADGEITVKDSSGNVIVTYTPEKKYQCVVISHPSLKVGETYTVTGGDSSVQVELTDTITGNGFGGMGGFGGGGFGGGGFGRGDRPDGSSGQGGMTPPDGAEMPDGMTPPEKPNGGMRPSADSGQKNGTSDSDASA